MLTSKELIEELARYANELPAGSLDALLVFSAKTRIAELAKPNYAKEWQKISDLHEKFKIRIKELEAQLDHQKDEYEGLIDIAEEQLNKVRPYIQHLEDCDMSVLHHTSVHYNCTCGLQQALGEG